MILQLSSSCRWLFYEDIPCISRNSPTGFSRMMRKQYRVYFINY